MKKNKMKQRENEYNPNLGFEIPGEIVTFVKKKNNISIDGSPENSSVHDEEEIIKQMQQELENQNKQDEEEEGQMAQ